MNAISYRIIACYFYWKNWMSKISKFIRSTDVTILTTWTYTYKIYGKTIYQEKKAKKNNLAS